MQGNILFGGEYKLEIVQLVEDVLFCFSILLCAG